MSVVTSSGSVWREEGAGNQGSECASALVHVQCYVASGALRFDLKNQKNLSALAPVTETRGGEEREREGGERDSGRERG